MKKYFSLSLICCAIQLAGYTQSIGIGTISPSPNAKLDIVDSTKGILIPRMNSTQKNNIPNTKGLMVFDTDTNSFWYNDGIKWQEFSISQDKKILTHIYLSDSF